jgi:hypothetical protein
MSKIVNNLLMTELISGFMVFILILMFVSVCLYLLVSMNYVEVLTHHFFTRSSPLLHQDPSRVSDQKLR